MFYLFILESIGTPELLVIGLVALIIFGPRKLPELARTFGKTMADFRRSTDEFKQTWQQEVQFEESKKDTWSSNEIKTQEISDKENSISGSPKPKINEINQPEVKELEENLFEQNFSVVKKSEPKKLSEKNSGKSDWL